MQWPFPADATVPARGFRVVWLDGLTNESTSGEWHAGFTVPPTGRMVVLSRDLGNSCPQVLDHLQMPPIQADHSFGSYPDARIGGRRVFEFTTPGSTSNPAYATVRVRINEWQADNLTTAADPTQFRIPPRVSIPPGGFLIVWADYEAGQFGFSFVSVPGKTYRLEYTDALDHPAWQTIAPDTIAGTDSLRLTAPTPAAGSRFYRIVVLD